MAQAEIVGSIGDVCVRRADAELFRPAQWLNDTCISAYFELLMTEKYPESDVLLLPGSMAFFMSHAGVNIRCGWNSICVKSFLFTTEYIM
jgi:hypothetical protein